MSLFVQTNVSSLIAQNYFSRTELALNKTMDQLSSGYKLNSTADDPAGFGIAAKMMAQVSAYSSASQTANIDPATSSVGSPSDGPPQLKISFLA